MKKVNKATDVIKAKAIEMIDDAVMGKGRVSSRYDTMSNIAWKIVRERIKAKKPSREIERIANKIIALHDEVGELTKKINALGWYIIRDDESGKEVVRVRLNVPMQDQEREFEKVMEELAALHRSLISDIGKCETVEQVSAVVKKADKLALKYRV